LYRADTHVINHDVFLHCPPLESYSSDWAERIRHVILEEVRVLNLARSPYAFISRIVDFRSEPAHTFHISIFPLSL
jgi:hypothetical protein